MGTPVYEAVGEAARVAGTVRGCVWGGGEVLVFGVEADLEGGGYVVVVVVEDFGCEGGEVLCR